VVFEDFELLSDIGMFLAKRSCITEYLHCDSFLATVTIHAHSVWRLMTAWSESRGIVRIDEVALS